MPDDWTLAMRDGAAFEREQRALATAWTMLGFLDEIPNDGDWITATIATRSVFVQRFGESVRGFENVCRHRFYPLRNGPRGNGPVICGFHHWQYDREGRLAGVPRCRELYGCTPRDLGVRLGRLDIATCGQLVFGRFPPAEGPGADLEAFLGDAHPILAALSRHVAPRHHWTTEVRANWHLSFHITLDDYHSPAVHPTTFGKVGYLDPRQVSYFRLGANSAFVTDADPDLLARMAQACRDGTFQPSRYTIFQLLPNLLVALFWSDGDAWHCAFQAHDAVKPDLTVTRTWLSDAPFGRRTVLRRVTDVGRRPLVRRYAKRVFAEDNAVCERIQQVIHQVEAPPLLGALEQRIAWFEESLRRMQAGAAD